MTADTYSNTLGFLIMGVGNDNNTWGGNCSTAVFQILEDAIANALTNTVTGGTLDLSGSPPPAAASQVRYAALIFNGTLTSNQTIKVPNLQKFWFVQNATSGAFTLKIQTPSGSVSTAIPQNSGWQTVYCDGANNIVVFPFNSQQVQMPDGSAAVPAYSNVNEPKSGWYRNGTQDWRLAINGVDVLQATGTGAGSPSILNVLTPNLLQQNGVQVAPNWVAAGGTADAITATYSPAITALTDGLLCAARATAANATTTPTFSPSGLTAHAITRKGGAVLYPGDIPGNLAEIFLRYNLANTRWELLNPAANASPPPAAAFKNLSIKVASNTTVAVAADYVTTTDGTNFQTTAVSATVNLGTTGANALDTGTIAIDTSYAIWVIAKPDGTTATLASTSFSAPTMPSGYTYKARVGAVRTIHASATLYGTWQFGRRAQFVVGLAQTTNLPVAASGSAGNVSTPTWVAVSLTPFLPPTASRVSFIAVLASSNTNMIVAPNNSYGGDNASVAASAPPININTTTTVDNRMGEFLLESTNIYWANNGGTGSGISILGWEDNI